MEENEAMASAAARADLGEAQQSSSSPDDRSEQPSPVEDDRDEDFRLRDSDVENEELAEEAEAAALQREAQAAGLEAEEGNDLRTGSVSGGDDEEVSEDEADGVVSSVSNAQRRLQVVLRDDGDVQLYHRRLRRWRRFLEEDCERPGLADAYEEADEATLGLSGGYEEDSSEAMDEWFRHEDFQQPPLEVGPGIYLPGIVANR